MPARYELNFPVTSRSILEPIMAGDEVVVSGIIVTSRDVAHKYFTEKLKDEPGIKDKLMPYLKGGAIYHCGPVIDLKSNAVISAGPTTSIREEPYQDKVIESFELGAVIGKGGMGEKTSAALVRNKALYLHAVGGAGSFYAQKLKVLDVLKLKEFGMPEAIWILEVKDFYTVVTMDFHGNNIHREIAEKSLERLKQALI